MTKSWLNIYQEAVNLRQIFKHCSVFRRPAATNFHTASQYLSVFGANIEYIFTNLNKRILMKSICVAISLFLTVLIGQARAIESAGAPKINGKFSIYANSVEGDNTSSKLTGSSIEGSITQAVSKDLQYALRGGILFETGSNKALLIDEFAPNQSAYLYESYVKADIFSPVSIKIGALNQEMYNSELLVTNMPFGAVMEQAAFNWGNTSLIIAAQQAIPNNQDLNQRLGSVQEGTPTFMMETVALVHNSESLAYRLNVGHFKYADLSASVAQNSQFLGNSVSGVNENAEFVYEYKGLNVSGDVALKFGRNIFTLKGQYLFNDGAPDGRNTGYTAAAAWRYGAFELEGLKFRNESDSSVAFYNNKWLGHNNRDGYAASARYFIPKQKTEFELSFINADLIASNVYQSKQEAVMLRLTRSYDVN